MLGLFQGGTQEARRRFLLFLEVERGALIVLKLSSGAFEGAMARFVSWRQMPETFRDEIGG